VCVSCYTHNVKHSLTLKAEQFLVKIIDWMAETGKSPTIREAQEIGGFASSRTVTQYFEKLEANGFITRGRGPRTLNVVADPRDTRPVRQRRTKRTAPVGDTVTTTRASAALLVDATDLDGWSFRRDAQEELPGVIRRLVFATTDRQGTVEFRSGEGVQLPGLDGFTNFDTRTSFVPAGPTLWEVGTSEDVGDKAQSDYRTRTNNPGELNPTDTTFIFVTSRRWREKADWVKRRRAEKKWRDVQAYDADDLATWLELAPGVHRWLSRRIGKGPGGAVDLATYAADWYEATKPALTPEFLRAGRDEAAKQVKEWLGSGGAVLTLKAETRPETAVFFHAVLQELPESDRERNELRTVVCETEAAWQQLSVSRDPLILIPLVLPSSVAGAERNGHRVILPLSTADKTTQDPVEIGPLDREASEPILKRLLEQDRPSDVVSDNTVREGAHLARRSVMAFRRVHGRTPALAAPRWSTPEHGRTLALVMLAGAWKDNDRGGADREAVSRITDRAYAELERELLRWSRESDAPVRRVGDRWLIVSKEDAWPLLREYLTREDLRRFHDVASEILSAVDPRLELEADQQWMANIFGKSRAHSGTLMTSLANTLALLGARGQETHRTAGESGQAVAASAVRTILDAANKDVRVWFSVAYVLPLLAEAAPPQFLDAIEKGLASPDPLLRSIFTDKPGTSSWSTSSPHVNVLWALERLAWSPEYLPRAASALAKLAVLDEPRGTTGNRPDASLRQLFLCWHPQTHATLEQRLAVLDRLRTSQPAIAWRVLVSLLPTDHDMSMNHQAAEWREWGVEPPRITRGEVMRAYREVITRVVDDVGDVPERWATVIKKLEKLPKTEALRALAKLEQIPRDTFGDAGAETVRTALRESISWHRSHPDAKWELSSDDIARMEAIHDRLESAEIEDRYRWLFARAPELPSGTRTYSDEYDAELSAARAGAVERLLEHGGLDALIHFAQGVEMPNDVGGAAALSGQFDDDRIAIIRRYLGAPEEYLDRFARGFTLRQKQKRGVEWAKNIIRDTTIGWSPVQRAVLLTFLPHEDAETWDLVAAQDDATQAEYWRRMYPWGVPSAQTENMTRNLIRHGRPFTAADVLASHVHLQSKETPPPELIADVLEAVLTVEKTDDQPPSNFGYDLGELAEALAKNPGTVPTARIAAIEWALVPLLSNHDLEPRVLHSELVHDPEFFTEMISLVYRPRGPRTGGEETTEPKELSPADRSRINTAFKLLESCHTFPGRRPDGSIDADAMAEWVMACRARLAAVHRTEVGDLTIGKILGSSPMGDDGVWPHESVRDIIEAVESSDLESGVASHVYNSRGVVTKSLREGGAQERELVRKYNGYADAVNEKWPRTAAMLREIAHFYERDAMQSDMEVEIREHLEH
jgi:hypothetical protein